MVQCTHKWCSVAPKIAPGDYRKPLGQRDQDFLRKGVHCKHFFFYLPRRSVVGNDTVMDKVSKGEGKTCVKKDKAGKGAEN